jgi:predicted DNA binding CopG/RHH family protein
MNANSDTDPLYDRLKDMDFEDAEPVAKIAALNRFQTENGGKSCITLRVDSRTLAAFKVRAAMTDSNYQTLMNEALAQFVQGPSGNRRQQA